MSNPNAKEETEVAVAPLSESPCSDLLDWLDGECFDLRCEDVSYGDDSDVIWIVYSHHMGKPKLRAEGYGKTAAAAIQDAMLPKDDPRKWDYVPDFDAQNAEVTRGADQNQPEG